MTDSLNSGVSLSPEELDLALSLRPKRPLTAPEIDTLREVIGWFNEGKREREAKLLAREARVKRYPLIFGAISALLAVIGGVWNAIQFFVHRP